MSNEEVADVLEGIQRGWLPQSYVLHGQEDETYTEDEYERSKLHIAINKVILMLREKT